LEWAAREWEKISIRIKTCNPWVTIGFERIEAPMFLPLRSQQGTGDWLCGGEQGGRREGGRKKDLAEGPRGH